MAEQVHQHQKNTDGDQRNPLVPLQAKAKLLQGGIEISPELQQKLLRKLSISGRKPDNSKRT